MEGRPNYLPGKVVVVEVAFNAESGEAPVIDNASNFADAIDAKLLATLIRGR